MMTIRELQDKWNNIPSYNGGFLLISGDHPLEFHIGYLGDGQKCFIVLNTGKVDKLSSSKAINVECIKMKDKSFALRFLLNYPSLDEIFVKLCWDLIDSSRLDLNPVIRIVEQYNSWMRLLQQVGNGVMSPSVQKGLIGELLYLNECIDSLGIESALNSWVGPEGSDQDFIFEDCWSEVKAVSLAANEISISSLQQLDRDDKGFIIVFFIEKTTANGNKTISLFEMIDVIKDKLANVREQDIFDCKLAKYGFLNKDAELYKTSRYRIGEKRTFSIDSRFPRLTHRNVPIEITNVKYKISLATIELFRVLED